MAGDTANAILSVIVEKVLTPVVDAIVRQFGYLLFYNRNIKNLKERVERLEESIKDTNSLFESKSWNNEERAHSSAGWLKNAEMATKAANKVVEDKDKLKGWCVNLKGRYVLSRKSTKIDTMIRELENQAPTPDATNRTVPAAKLHGSSSNDASKDFKTQTKVMDKVMEALKDDKINIIGICGLGGVGKTTILDEVRERAITESIFAEVVMTTVTQVQNQFNIQSDIASMLGLTSIKEVENIIARAALLHKRLTNGSKILVILDDIWSAFELKEVGIPVGNDRANCKVVLASRDKIVCTNMKTQETISVKELTKEEAWHLFKKIAGDCVEKDKLEKIAKEVAGECGGLPIALKALARALSNKNKGVWEHALTQLRQSNVTRIHSVYKEVYPSIKLSYDFLASELPEAQSFLLICCQHAEDAVIKVEKLARYCLALELFKNVDKFVDVRNNTYAVIDHLTSCFLLQVVDVDEEEKYQTVKVHDVVRDVCLSILSEMKEDRDKVYMHFMGQDMDEIDKSKVDYSKVKILKKALLHGSLIDISLLQQMKELRVFGNCRGLYDKQPPALHVLENLRMLSLEYYPLSEEIISSIGSLSRLEILSFWRSRISSFPRQIGQLSNLKVLDLRFKRGGGRIPSGILLRLKKLEVLCMGDFLLLGANKDPEDTQNGESYGRITELESLSNLTTLQIELEDVNDLLGLHHFRFEKLENFYFGPSSRVRSLVHNSMWLGDHEGMKWVLEAKIQYIVTTIMSLVLSEIRDWTDPCILEKFVSVRELTLHGCRQLEYVLTGRSLGELLSLSLSDMPKMRHLWVVPTDLICLGNLRVVEIHDCHAIKSVFPRSASNCLVQLQTLMLDRCQELKRIVTKEELGITSTSRGAEIKEEFPNDLILLFPKLRELELRDLNQLGVYKYMRLQGGMEQQAPLNALVIAPSLETLTCESMHQLEQIVGGGMKALSKLFASDWLQNLKKMDVKFCYSLETLFDFEGLYVTGANAHVQTLTKLEAIYLSYLPSLEHLCMRIPQGINAFQNLETLELRACHSLGYLISSSMAHTLVNLQRLCVEECDSMKDVIKMNVDFGEEKIVFSSLCCVVLKNLGKLSSFCSHDQQSIEFPSLGEVFIDNCPDMKTFSCGHLTAEKLYGVKTSYSYYNDDQTLIWKGGLNETVRHLNTRVNQMKNDEKEDGFREEITDECTNEDGNGGSNSTPPEQDTTKKASTPQFVVPPSPPVSDNNSELANSSSRILRNAALPPLIELLPSVSMEHSVHSGDCLEQTKADTELSDMPLLSRDDDRKTSRILLQGVYVKAELRATFEEILIAKPNFLSGLRLKTVEMKTGAVESAIHALQILRQRTALTISSEELAYVKDSLDDLEGNGLDTAWLERGYQRAILMMKEQKVVSATEELAMLERERMEDEAAFEMAEEKLEMAREMAREMLETSTARRDDFRAEYGALIQELEEGKELFGGDFDLETSLGNGLLG